MPPRRLPTFSALGRADLCRASAVLPTADNISEAATSGTVMHAFLLRVAELRKEGREPDEAADLAAQEAPEDERDFLASIPVENLPTDPAAFAGEVALALDVATGKARELGRNIDRRYEEAAAAQGKPLAPTEFVGSLDVAALMGADGAFVADWKKRGRYVSPARENLQIKAGIVAACRAWGRQRGAGEIIRIYEDGRPPYVDRMTLSAAEVDTAQRDLTLLAARIFRDRQAHAKGEQIPATTGDHCRYCASFAWCPSNLALVREMAGPDLSEAGAGPLITRENFPVVLRRLTQAKQVIGEVEEALDRFASQEAARNQPLEVEPGYVFAPFPRPRESIDAEKAEATLIAELGEAGKLAIEKDVTKTAIKKAIRKAHGSKGIGKREEALLERLRAAGAVKKTVSYTCEVRARKQGAQPALIPDAVDTSPEP
jgi:hypothetical protein